jgi:hypothetical protein
MITVLTTGDPRRQAVDAAQARAAELVAERKAVARADVPREELEVRCARAAEGLLADDRGMHRVRQIKKPGQLTALVQRRDTELEIVSLLATIIGKQTIGERLLELSVSDPLYKPGLPERDRAARLAELDRQLVDVLVAEELECVKLERDGATWVVRRPIAELDIDAILRAWASTSNVERVAAERLA